MTETHKYTIRVYRKQDKELLSDIKKDFMDTSLSKAILRLGREYYRLKHRDDLLRKAVHRKYEISTETIEKLFR